MIGASLLTLFPFIFLSLFELVCGTPGGTQSKHIEKASNPPIVTGIEDPGLHVEFNKAIENKNIVRFTRHPIISTLNEDSFPDIKIHHGSEYHHVASFYLNKPSGTPEKSSRTSIRHTDFVMPIENHKDGQEVFRDTANYLHSQGYKYSGHNGLQSGQNLSAKHKEPVMHINSGKNVRADGHLLSVLMRDKPLSPKQSSPKASSSQKTG